MATIAAFFDLDGTLIDVNSGLLWAKHERRVGQISAGQLMRAALWSVLYRLSLVDMEAAFAEATRHYRGQLHDSLHRRTRDWFQLEVEPRLRPGAPRTLDRHRDQGHLLVLLTSSSSVEASVAAATWGLDHWLANRFPVDARGRLDGSFERPLCYGPGKVLIAERFAREHDVDLDSSFFYSDSYSDLPMLERVGEPRVVCPDPRLRWTARRRGWSTVDWS